MIYKKTLRTFWIYLFFAICIFSLIILILTQIPVEKSFPIILEVDENDTRYVLTNSQGAYYLNDQSKIILQFNDSVVEATIVNYLEKIENNLFRFELTGFNNRLLAGSQLQARIISECQSLLNRIFNL